MTTPLRPRSAIEIVDTAFALWRRNFVPMTIIGLAASLPVILLGIMAVTTVEKVSGGLGAGEALLPFALAVAAVGMLWLALVDGAMTIAAGDAYFGRPVTPGGAIRGALARGGTLVMSNVLRLLAVASVGIVAAVLVPVIVRAGAPLLAIPLVIATVFSALLIFVRLFATTSTIVFEDVSVTESLSRSFTLSRHSAARILGIILLSWVIVWVAQVVAGLTVQLALAVVVRNPLVIGVVGNVIGMLLYPFLSISLMVLYYDQRIRNEGYDLDVMSEGLAPAANA